MKEQEEKQLEQDNDEMMYTYVRDNERKVNANSTYDSSAQHSLVARNLGHSIASHSDFFSSLSRACVQREIRTIDTDSPTLDENIRKHRLQLASSPPSSPVETIRDRTSFHINENRISSDFLDTNVDGRSGCKRNTSNSSAKLKWDLQQPVFIVDSLQTLRSLSKRLVITFPHRKSILTFPGRSSFRNNE